MTKNATLNKAIMIATVAGASALVIKSAMSLTGVKKASEAIMPVVSILVGVAAFNYAVRSGKDLVVSEPKK